MGAAIAPLMEEFFKDTGFDRKHHNFHYTPGLLLSKVEDPLKYIEQKKKLFDQVYPKQYVTGNELTTIKENSGIQGSIIATGIRLSREPWNVMRHKDFWKNSHVSLLFFEFFFN